MADTDCLANQTAPIRSARYVHPLRLAVQVQIILSPAYLDYVLGQAPRPHIPA